MGQLAEALKAGPPADARKRCGVCKWAATLDDDDRAILTERIAKAAASEDGWNFSNLHKRCQGIEGNPLDMALPAFTKHAKGQCSRG